MYSKEDKTIKCKVDYPRLSMQYSSHYPISLSNLRIIQKHLVYVIGLSEEMTCNEILGKYEYFGQYGNIQKITVNKTKVYNKTGSSNPNYSAYISYALEGEASLAILAIDNFQCGEYLLRASYGTTKYCTFFLKGSQCPNKDCLYYHTIANEEDIINKDDMNSSSNVFYQQQKTAMRICDIFSPETKQKLKYLSSLNRKTIFPTASTIYFKEIVIKNELLLKTHYKGHDKQTYPLQNKKENQQALELGDTILKTNYNEGLDTSSLYHGKNLKVISPNNKNWSSSASSTFKTFESIKFPDEKRLTFDNTNTINSSSNMIFKKHNQSRFDFSDYNESSTDSTNSKWFSNEAEDTLEVPNYILDIVSMSLSRFSFFKRFKDFNDKETDQLMYKTFSHHDDSWSKFLMNNKQQ